MTGVLLLELLLFQMTITGSQSFSFDFWLAPKYQEVNEYEDIVIDCGSMMFDKVYWTRPKGLSLSRGALQRNGRLIINNIRYKDRGEYICYDDANNTETAFVVVHRRTTTVATTLQTRPVTFGLEVTKNKEVETTPNPCPYSGFNKTSCKNDIAEEFFDCANGQKINKTLVCNRVNDCYDGSDEAICSPWPPKITVLPKSDVKVYCGDQDKSNAGTLVLECESVGHPTPLIRWVKYEGHVPSKCQQYSKGGRGSLKCPDFQQSDQGSYSCVAENSVKLAESQPKSLARCSNIVNCNGFKVLNKEQIQHCLECYCSGKTSSCQNIKSNLTINKIIFPKTLTEIFVKDDGEITFIPTKNNFTPNAEIIKSSQEINYCVTTENELTETSFLKSFGRSIIIPKYKGKTNFLPKAPNLILQGNGLSLMYTANLISPPRNSEMDMSVRFWPGNWHHLDKKAATRRDLMKVLSNVNALYIRCEYEEGKEVEWGKNATIFLESSLITDFTNSVSYVEKCSCPSGYDGLSCESCAAGYKKVSKGNDFICERIPPPPCKEGYKGVNCTECDTFKGFYRKGSGCEKAFCHPDGAKFTSPDSSGKCVCKDGVTGDSCDKCTNGFFHLHKAKGCLKCWCSGITNQCQSSTLYRSAISNIPRGGYNSSDGRNFWLLPPNFSGNRLTSYGGHLNYTITYKPDIPKENTYLTVEILSKNDVTVIYTHENKDDSKLKTEKSWSVPITETKWRKSDRSSLTRGEFLAVLSKVKAVYIESPYHLSSGQANLTSARLSSADTFGDVDTPLALEVEKCVCPEGYTGLSCESCSEGYYKKRNRTITECIKCNCPSCDPEFGCSDCPLLTYRDNPEVEKMPVCKPCPCNGNGVSCTKDDHNQIFCRCKAGFTGMHCENTISSEKDELTITISPRRIKGRKLGTVVNLNCSFISNENMTLWASKKYLSSKQSFIKSTNNNSELETNQGKKIWNIFEVVLENGLEAVECFVYDSQGRVAGQVIAHVEDLITVFQPVKIRNCYSDTMVIRESESKEIICEATGSPTPMVNWYKTVNGSEAEKLDASEGVHTIESVSLSDNGTIYSCIAENSEGDKATCTFVLLVRKKCEIISVFPTQVRVEEGKSFLVQCKTTAKDQSIKWSIWDERSQTERSIFNFRTLIVDGVLRVENATLSDSGIYICSAKGENGRISNNVTVIVQEKRIPPAVHIKEDDRVLREGESFAVNCIATGKPTPNITWTKVNDVLHTNVILSGKTLTIEKATTKNSGVYACEARSVAGSAISYISIEVEALYPPKVNISQDKTIKAQSGDNVTVTCLAIGYPRPTLTWFAPNISLKVISKKKDDMILVEPYLSVKEEASFIVAKNMNDLTISCFAENAAGKDQVTTQVKVLQPKIAINETVEFVPIGSSFVLNCHFSGALNWIKVGGLLGEECFIPYGLMIKSVQIQHNGTYICTAGPDEKKIIHLIVTGFVPKFSRELKSYLVLTSHSTSNNEARIEISFRSTHEKGLLLQKENNGLDIYLEKRKIHVRTNSGDGKFFDIKMNNPIELNRWYFLVVSIRVNYVDITVYNENSAIHERQIENSKDFNITLGHGGDSFFVGGPITKARHTGRKYFHYHAHFDGCMSRLIIDGHEFDIVKEGSFSHEVSLCRRCSEEENICSKNGKCLDAPTQYGFICVCPDESKRRKKCRDSCVGKVCETQLDLCALLNPCNGFKNKCSPNLYHLKCECGASYSGTSCEIEQKFSFCARGNGYIRLPSNLLERRLGVPEVIDLAFTLHKRDGQLLWQGDKTNHLSISVRNGRIEYSYLNQHSKLEIHGVKELELNKKHTLSIERLNNTVTIDVNMSNDIKAVTEGYKNFTDKIKTDRVTGDIYLGFVPKSVLGIGQHPGLDGCIHHIVFDGKSRVDLSEKQLEEFNVYSPVESINEGDDDGDDDGDELTYDEDDQLFLKRKSISSDYSVYDYKS